MSNLSRRKYMQGMLAAAAATVIARGAELTSDGRRLAAWKESKPTIQVR